MGFLVTLLGMIPGVGRLVEGITAKYFDTKVRLVTARVGGDVTVATALVKASTAADHEMTAKLSVFASNPMLTGLLIAFATPLVVYDWKIIIWDIVFAPYIIGHTDTTDPIRGEVLYWSHLIMMFLFGTHSITTLSKMYFNRDKTGE